MLISELKNQCKDKGKIFEKGRLFLIEQNLSQHSDFITVSWLIHQLENSRKVVLVAFRENYAHFSSLSKKLGKPIEPYLKSKQLKYYESFENIYNCSELPLTETFPNCFLLPPTSIERIKEAYLIKKQHLFEENSIVFVDAISFARSQTIIKLYEQAMNKNCKIVLAGAMEDDEIVKMFRAQADIYIKLQNDVGNHGKLRLAASNSQLSIHWKYIQGKFQLTQYIKL